MQAERNMRSKGFFKSLRRVQAELMDGLEGVWWETTRGIRTARSIAILRTPMEIHFASYGQGSVEIADAR